ncbi:hypothetical protein [Paenibacillus sp. FJAT-26967]|uniref:hypothetical protein n=1 Tax=Paenibacillus sp. FJAT-26967 TaxID=1729690 RepID=UPI000839966F|nr:hypothetical protein [Paenibacillus sp. FJAT-26967]
MISNKLKKLLFSIYWDDGWLRSPKLLNEEDASLLRKEGLYVDQLSISHDDVIQRMNTIVLQYSPESLGNYLLASLSDRILEYRAIPDCYSNLRPVIPHKFMGSGSCQLCGISKESEHDITQSIFTIHKFGAGDTFFAFPNVFILEKYIELEEPLPNKEDIAVMRKIVKEINTLHPNDGAISLALRLKSIIKSNDEERHLLIELLAKMGIIEPSGDLSEKYKKVPTRSNWFGPASIWKGRDSVNPIALKHYFPHYYKDLF